jgi:transketolase C-terminal domain/subunit
LATFSAFAVASPTYLRLGKNGEKNFGEDGQIEHKAIRPIVKEGNAVAVLSTGSIGSRVESTQKDLLTPVDHFSIEEVWPVGEELWGLISSYDHVIVVEEHSPIGGLYTMLAEGCSLRSIRTRLSSCAIDRTRLITAGDHDYMLDQAGLSVSSISAKIASVL